MKWVRCVGAALVVIGAGNVQPSSWNKRANVNERFEYPAVIDALFNSKFAMGSEWNSSFGLLKRSEKVISDFSNDMALEEEMVQKSRWKKEWRHRAKFVAAREAARRSLMVYEEEGRED